MNEPDPSPSADSLAAAARAWRKTDFTENATCLDCGYRLRGLPEARCPECGRWFNRYDPESMKVPGYRRPSPVRPTTFGDTMVNLAVTAMSLAWCGRALFCLPVDVAAWALWGVIGFRWARHRKRVRAGTAVPEQEAPRWRAIVVSLFVLSLVLSVRYYSCPHATTVGVGTLGLSYGKNGPCHGGIHDGGVRIVGNWWLASLRA